MAQTDQEGRLEVVADVALLVTQDSWVQKVLQEPKASRGLVVSEGQLGSKVNMATKVSVALVATKVLWVSRVLVAEQERMVSRVCGGLLEQLALRVNVGAVA